MSVYTHLDEGKLPALAQNAVFQKKMVDLLDEKLRKALCRSYDPFIMKMLGHTKDILTVNDWIEAFSHVASTAVKDDCGSTCQRIEAFVVCKLDLSYVTEVQFTFSAKTVKVSKYISIFKGHYSYGLAGYRS